MLVASVADCFAITFRAIASASKMEWLDLECSIEGKLERVDRVTSFTAFEIRAKLPIGAGMDIEKARCLLEKVESNCLISSSLRASCHLQSEVMVK
ncbi:MAG: putative OsmC-like protein [Halioglobus sp.]